MRVAPIRRTLTELLRKRPPPPSLMRRLPEATHGYPWHYPPRGGKGTPATPPRPTKPGPLLEAQAQAESLTRRRRAMLERAELHQHHSHHDTKALIAGAGLYVLTHDSPPPPIPQASPFERWVVAASVPAIEETIKGHQWGKQWRANDLRVMLELEPRGW